MEKVDKGCDPQAATAAGLPVPAVRASPSTASRAALPAAAQLPRLRERHFTVSDPSAARGQLPSGCPGATGRVDSWAAALAIPSAPASWSRPPTVGHPASPASRAGKQAKGPSLPWKSVEQGGQDLHQELLGAQISTTGKSKACSKLTSSNIVLSSSVLKEEVQAHVSYICQNKPVLKGQQDDKTHHQRRCWQA